MDIFPTVYFDRGWRFLFSHERREDLHDAIFGLLIEDISKELQKIIARNLFDGPFEVCFER